MCLISIIPEGVKKEELLIKGFLENGMDSNTDGSGFAIKKNGILHINKGFRSHVTMLTAIMSHKLKIDDELIIHHRIGTSGRMNDINMHPFLVSEDTEVVSTVFANNVKLPIMAHNGIFGQYTDRASEFSDTFHFIRDFMATEELVSLLKKDSKKFEKLFKSVLNSNKLVFLFPDRPLALIGIFQEDAGCFHSNGGYKTYEYNRGGYSSCNYQGSLPAVKNSYKNRSAFLSGINEADDTNSLYRDNHLETERLISSRGTGIDNLLEKPLKQISSDSISFNYRDIVITENNYHHFIFVLKPEKSILFPGKYKGYEIEDFDEIDGLTPIIAGANIKVLEWIKRDEFIKMCTIYPKSQFKGIYYGLSKLIKKHGYYPSKSCVKKMKTLLSKKYKNYKGVIKFKEFGEVNYFDLEHYYDSVKEYVVNLNELDTFIKDKCVLTPEKVEKKYFNIELPIDYPEHVFDMSNERTD